MGAGGERGRGSRAGAVRRLGVALVLLVVVPANVSNAPAAAEQVTTPCHERSWIGGMTEWCDGVLVYRDYVYDDTGADTRLGSLHGTPLSRATGDVDHRSRGQSLNSADLLTLRVWADAGNLRMQFDLNTLLPTDQTVAAVAIDTDDDAATGGGRWGSVLPVDVAVSSAGWDLAILATTRDHTANTITASIPMPAFAAPDITIRAVVALKDGTPMNVAFRPDESGNWWEQQQSAALAKGRIDHFGARIRVADLLAGTTHRPAPLPGPGLWERVYTSDYQVGEGVSFDGLQIDGVRGTYHYLGRHQPYAIYVPPPVPGGVYGLQLALHGASAAHASLVNQRGMQDAFGALLAAHQDLPRVVVVPLGRGPNGQYVDYSERDVLDVISDVLAHYPVDPDRVFAGGYSMGGMGTYWLASLRPDTFAGAVNWVGYTADCLNGTPVAQGRQRPDPPFEGLWTNEPGSGCEGGLGNVLDYLEGTRHVPMAMVYAAGDELVWANHAAALTRRYAGLRYEHVMWMHPAAEHLTFAILDNWTKEALWTAGRTRVRSPRTVSYRTNTYFWFAPADIRHDSAYWVRGLQPRVERSDPAGDIAVELVSHACDRSTDYNIEVSYGVGAFPVPWVSQEGARRVVDDTSPANRISGTVRNASALTIDVDRACLTSGPIELAIAVDGPTQVAFSDGRPPVNLQPTPHPD